MAKEGKKKKQQKCEDHGGGGGHEAAGMMRWLLTYADMITLLLGLFIILYALSSQEESRIQELSQGLQIAFGIYQPASSSTGAGDFAQGPPNVSPNAEYRALYRQVSTIAETRLGHAAEITQDERGVVISLSDNILFDSDSATITQQGKEVLDNLSQLLNMPMVKDHQISVEAHTDNLPSRLYKDNWELSADRSLNTTRFISQEGMIDPNRIRGTFFGEHKPKIANQNMSPEERAENRRVEIVILHTPDMQREFFRQQARERLRSANE